MAQVQFQLKRFPWLLSLPVPFVEKSQENHRKLWAVARHTQMKHPKKPWGMKDHDLEAKKPELMLLGV